MLHMAALHVLFSRGILRYLRVYLPPTEDFETSTHKCRITFIVRKGFPQSTSWINLEAFCKTFFQELLFVKDFAVVHFHSYIKYVILFDLFFVHCFCCAHA